MQRSQLRVAQLAPPWYSIPPDGYGGIEWVCFWLAEGLMKRGHDVTLIGAGSNDTEARQLTTFDHPQWSRLGDAFLEVLHAARAHQHVAANDFDIVHDHTMAGPLSSPGREAPTVVTMHGPVDEETRKLFSALDDVALVAISDAQRQAAPELPWVGTVHNSLEIDEYPFEPNKDDYLLWLGRMNQTKGPCEAIEAARAAGRRIVLAGKCNEPEEHQFFEEKVAPLLGDQVEWVGEADTDMKKRLLAKARCLVFPIDWEEPFGMVMIEAMACGTPVVATRRGSVPEVVEDGTTGFIADDIAEFPSLIQKVHQIDPARCRKHVEAKFDTETMVEGYESIYHKLIAEAG